MKKSVIKLISSLNQVPFPESELPSFLKMAEDFSAIDWNYFFELVKLNAVSVLTLKRLEEKNLSLKVPASNRLQLEKLKKEVERILVTNQKRNHWTKTIIDIFTEQGIPLILLKGAYLGPEIYGDPSYKKMNDVDLLISEKNLDQGLTILKKLEFHSVGEFFSSLEFKREESHHTPPFIEKNGECVTGLHWNLVSPYSSIKISAQDLINRAQLNQDGKSYGLKPEDNLLHLCIHLPYFKTGLRELADVSNLINNKKIDWNDFYQQVDKAKAWSRVYRVLTLAKAMIHFSVPDDIIQKIKAKSVHYIVHETDLLASDPEKLFSSRSTYAGKVEKYFIVFKISNLLMEKLFAYLMMWWLIFFIPPKELRKFQTNRLTGSIYLWRALGLDHGEKALLYITIGNFFEMIKYALKYPFGPKGRSLKHHPQYYLLKVLE